MEIRLTVVSRRGRISINRPILVLIDMNDSDIVAKVTEQIVAVGILKNLQMNKWNKVELIGLWLNELFVFKIC